MKSDDDIAPVIVADRKADIARSAAERLRKMAAPPKAEAKPKPPLLDAAKAESQAIDDDVAMRSKEQADQTKAAEAGISPGTVIRDVVQGIMETFTFNPARNAVLTGAVNSIDEIGDSLADTVLYPFGLSHRDLDHIFGVIETEGPQSATGKLVSSVSQFATSMYLARRGLGALGLPAAGAGGSLAAGTIATTFGFDEADARLSDIIQGYPALRNPITEYLAGDPDDTFLEAKTKQAIEGLIGGGVSELLFRGVKGYRAYSQAKAAQPRAAASAAIRQADAATSVDEALELTPRDWVALGGDPERPLISVTSKTAEQADELGKAMGPSTPAPVDFVPGQIRVGEKVANINLNRIEGPEQLREVARRVGKIMLDEVGPPAPGAATLGPTIRQSTDEARALSDILLESPDTIRSWLGGQSATGRAFSREEIIGAGEVLTKNLEATRALAQKIATGAGTDADKLAFHRSFALQQSMMALVSQQSREAGRALQAFRTTVGGNKAAARAIRDIMSSEGNTEKMASMLLALQHPGQASAFMKNVVEGGGVLSKAGNVAMEIFYNGILSGPRTHMVNVIGNSMNVLTATAERGVAARLPGATVPQGEEMAMLWGSLRGFKDGLTVARQVWNTGVPLQDAAVNQVIKRRAITSEKLVPRSWRGNAAGDWLAAGVDALGTAIRLPGRALMTSDEFFKTIARGQQTAALAYRRATAEGLTGEALAARVQELRTNPTPDMVDQAFDFAAYQTFSRPLGETGGAVQRILAKNRWAQLVMPFVQTPANILKYATARTPLGFVMKSVRDDIAAGGARRDLAMAQIGLGSMVMATAADYAAQGFITGAAPGDPGQRAAWERAGILPYSIKIPGTDTWVQYTRLDPVGFTVGLAADFSGIMSAWTESEGLELSGPDLGQVRRNLAEKWKLSPAEVDQAIDRLNLEQQQAGRITPERVGGALVTALRNNMLSRSYLSGIADLFGAFEAPSAEMQADGVGRYLQRTAQGFVPFSAAIRTAEQVLDPQMRDAVTAMEALRSMIPGASESLAPIPDLWGRPRETTVGLSPVAVSQERDSPIDHELIRLRLSLGMPSKDIQGTRMAAEEYASFVKLAGDGIIDPATGLTAKGTLDAMVAGTHPQPGISAMYRAATDGPDGGKALMIKTILEQYRDAARKQVAKDFPALRAAIAERKRLAEEALR